LHKKYPEVYRDERFDLVNRFVSLDTDTPRRIDKVAVLRALQSNGESYDQARETLKHAGVGASGKVELRLGGGARPPSVCHHRFINSRYSSSTSNFVLKAKGAGLSTKVGKVTVQGSNANVSHTINEDPNSQIISTGRVGKSNYSVLANAASQVLENDPDIGPRFPTPTPTMSSLVNVVTDGPL
ncbi:hypothetical protein BV22DRAFT_1022221, partial [Leucogyrophana mollusca]